MFQFHRICRSKILGVRCGWHLSIKAHPPLTRLTRSEVQYRYSQSRRARSMQTTKMFCGIIFWSGCPLCCHFSALNNDGARFLTQSDQTRTGQGNFGGEDLKASVETGSTATRKADLILDGKQRIRICGTNAVRCGTLDSMDRTAVRQNVTMINQLLFVTIERFKKE
jgi:hypothetical protein